MVDALVSVVAENLLKRARDETILLTGVGEELEDLSGELRTIRVVLQDAEMKQIQDKAVRIWLQKLKYVAYEIEDMVEAWDQAVRNSSPPFSCMMHPVRHSKFGHKVKTIKEKLAKIASEKDKYHLREKFQVREIGERQTSSLVEQSSVIGRDGDKETLRRKLIEEDLACREGEVPSVAIVGMGGLGKTTLAQVVFNDEEIRSNFKKYIWVCISNDFNVKDILINIVKNGGGSIYKCDDDQIELIQQEVVKVIGNKQYLLILDDVWNEDELKWEPLQNILNCGANGSRIVVTTRNRGVARAIRSVYIHDLGILPKDECWSIFQKLVFDKSNHDIQEYKDLEEIGKQIVERCSGLPLAVKTIASAIRKKAGGKQPTREQLENILNNEIWNVSDSNVGILPALMLSYIELPLELKNCFCYCSLFEKDFVFKKDFLIKLWVAQGYVVAKDEQREVECIAEEYFDELLDRSLFQEPYFDEYGSITRCKMHDLVHDLAQWLTNTEFSIIKSTPPKNGSVSLGNARHCAIFGVLGRKRKISLTGAENLRTFIYLFQGYMSFDKGHTDGVIKQLQSARVLSLQELRMREVHGLERLVHLRYLSLHHTEIKVLPKSIGKLKELRYLDLSNTKLRRLPETITSLSRLQTLNLSDCWDLRKLPNGISRMGSLRHLDVSWCGILKKFPDGIGMLTLLQTLSIFPVAVGVGGGKGGRSNIGELGGLNRLHGRLTIDNLGAVESDEEVRTAKLWNKTSLVNIQLRWDSRESPHPAAMEGVWESLHPPPALEKLRIDNYPGKVFPSWMGDGSAFLLLSHVQLWDCKNCTKLPPLGQLPCLKNLWIYRLSGVKKVGGEFLHLGFGDDDQWGTSIVAFPQLESLDFIEMDCWERWVSPLSSSSSSSSIVKKAATANATILFPRLRELSIIRCPKLEGVAPIFTTALQTLRISDCPALPSSQFLPPSLQSLTLGRLSTEKLLADCPTTLLPSLQHLSIEADSELTDQLPLTILHLADLQSLCISSCKNLRTLPEELTRLTHLHKLEIFRCSSELSEGCKVGGLLWPRIAHIPRIRIDSREVQNNAC